MKAVKFIKDYDPYEPGHVVDLPDQLADKLIAEEVAKELKGAQPSPVTVRATNGGGN